MNKEQIEKMFDDMFTNNYVIKNKNNITFIGDTKRVHFEIKAFVFNTIIPEVLKNVLPDKREPQSISSYTNEFNACSYCGMMYGEETNEIIDTMRQKAKELYNINL